MCVYGEMPTLLQHAEVGAVPTNNMVLDLVPSVFWFLPCFLPAGILILIIILIIMFPQWD